MKVLLIILAVIAGIFVLMCILAGIAGVVDRIFYPLGHDVSPVQVCKELELILDGHHPRALDDFISSRSFKNPRLEAIRRRIAQLDEEFPPESKGEYCSPKGMEIIREYIRELKHDSSA